MLATNWGNSQFDKTELPEKSFITGVAFHDRGYPRLDNFPINELEETKWLDLLEQGASRQFSDLVAEVVILKQIRRVLKYRGSEQRDLLAKQIDESLPALIKASGYSKEQFEFADRITAFADSLSYHFCLGQTEPISLKVFRSLADMRGSKETELTISFKALNEISLSPWPFSNNHIETFVVSYKSEGYPERIEPELQFISVVPEKT